MSMLTTGGAGLGSILAGVVTAVTGGAIATVTVLGLASSQVNSHAGQTADADQPVIVYGSSE